MVKIQFRKSFQRQKTLRKADNIQSCCNVKKQRTKCIRKSDGKIFKLPRRFSRKKCSNKKHIRGFTMRSSCAPYKDC